MAYYIDEDSIKNYLSDYMDYLKTRDNNVKTIFVGPDDEENRGNVGAWYNREPDTGEHRIFFNMPNLDCLLYYLANEEITIDQFFGILTLFAGHEYRHFEQGRCMWDGKSIDGFNEQDGLETQMVLYIRYFFDVYYKRNKGYLKCEEDAELFAIKTGLDFIKSNFPKINAEQAILDSANFIGALNGKVAAIGGTLPYHSNTLDELVKELNRRIEENYRHPWLPATLRVTSLERAAVLLKYGIDYEALMTDEFIYGYKELKGGYNMDLYVVKRLLEMVNDKEGSLREFNLLKAKYLAKKL